MDETEVRDVAARALAHPVPLALAPSGGRPIAAASLAGDPPRVRVAWVDPDSGEVLGRVAAPPGRPSRPRPVVATVLDLSTPEGAADRLLAARAAPGVAALRAVIAAEEDPPDQAVGPDGMALLRLPLGAVVLAVDALDDRGEPVGRLLGAALGELRVGRGPVGGRLGMSHGMGAGIGPGRDVADLDAAAFEAGYAPVLPAWLPEGLAARPPRVEPDGAYPSAPPAIVTAWGGEGEGRVLVRQAPAPLASPDTGGAGAREAPVGEATAVLRGRRWFITVVWETPERAFGVQVLRMPDAEEVALRVARSIPAVADDQGSV